MELFEEKPLKLAILDMYDGHTNQGMRCIDEIVNRYKHELDYRVFDVRGKAELPDTSYDIYISTGGPGSPFDGDGVWDKKYYDFIEELWNINQSGTDSKKYVFFICHSFQMACIHFDLGEITRRKSMSFGTFPTHLTDLGVAEPLFKGLDNPFWIADFRDWQVVQPKLERFEEIGAQILVLEKIRPSVPYERAIMAIRFSEEFFGVQFHPEADGNGMLQHFQELDKLKFIVNKYGKDKYATMITDLRHPDKIEKTNETILPNFLEKAIQSLKNNLILV